MSTSTFKDLNLSVPILKALDELGFVTPTEIQAKAIPLLLSSKRIDFHGQAQTGTGKTLAFGIPLLQKIDTSKKEPQALVVAPTRELAVQIYESLAKIGNKIGVTVAVIYGGVSIEEQMRILKKGVHIIVGTPGRLNDHVRKKTLNPDAINTLVLDEADIMLDMGFKEDIDAIMRFLPKNRQIWLFSATIKSGIADIMKKHMTDTVSVLVTAKMVTATRTKQYYSIVPFKARLHAITRFIQSTADFYGFIFCQTKALSADVAEELLKRGYNVAALHGDLSQSQRNIVIKRFRQKQYTVLVATDVAARGIDIPDITHVINYSIPEDLESYVHRVGRTGRAGKEGIAITFINKTEQRIIAHVERRFGVLIEPVDVPSRETVIEKRLASLPEALQELSHKKVPEQQKLDAFLADKSAAELKKIASALIFETYFSKLDLEEIPYVHVDASEMQQFQEIYINVGAEDGITQEDIRAFVLQVPVVKPDQIMTIRVIKRRSFVKLSSDCSPNLVSSLRGKLLKGRKVAVNVTCLISDGMSERGKGVQSRRRGSFKR